MLRKTLKFFAPLALSACVGAAFADDSSVTLYGVLDASIANVAHTFNFDPNMVSGSSPLINPNAGTQAATGIFSGGLSPSRWGIKGQEDMGGGVKGIFQLESAINIGTGTLSNAALALTHNTAAYGPNVAIDSALNGQLFSRGAFVGLSSTQYGTLTVGRNTSFMVDNIGISDPMLGSYAFSPIGYAGSYGGGGFTDDSRVDNSLKYKVTFADFTLGLLYKFGGVAGSTSAQNAYQVNGVYSAGSLAVMASYEQFKDAFSIGNTALTAATGAVTGTLPVTAADTKAYMLAAKYAITPQGRVSAGYEREQFNNPSNPGTAYNATTGALATGDMAVNSLFGYSVASVTTNAYATQKSVNVYWLGGSYDVTSAFTVSLAGYHASQNSWTSGNTGATNCSNNNTKCSGAVNYFSLVGDYHLSKRTDVYLGIMTSNASGGIANSNIVKNPVSGAVVSDTTSNRITALGVRHTF
jgi:GBP family porin